MNRLVFLVPGPLQTRTGGYEYDRRILAGLRAAGWTGLEVRELDASFPSPTPAAREHARRVLAEIPDATQVLIDGLALGVLPDEAAREAGRLQIVALVHHPLALETGLDEASVRAFEAAERRALAVARHVVVTSRRTAHTLATRYGVDADRISVVEPGTDPAPVARGSQSGIVHMLSVASLTPRKGYDVLFRALGTVDDTGWRLACVGSLDRDPVTVSRLRGLLRECQLDERVTLEGEAEGPRLADYYDRADLFVLPTLYEGYGMAVAEAIARGLAVVATTTGAIPAIVPDTAGILVPPGDQRALAEALRSVLTSADLRARLAAGARAARGRLSTWDASVAEMARVLDRVRRG